MWTGGWDSTFRVLDLLIVRNQEVQPYYIIDPSRPSLSNELNSIYNIREKLIQAYPSVKLNHLIFKCKNELSPNHKITFSFKEIQKMGHIGPQYEWLSRFANELGLIDLELGVEKQGTPSMLHKNLDGTLQKVDNEHGDIIYRLGPASPELYKDVFDRFHFPLFYTSKQNMKSYAIKHNFLKFLELTWFCHTPILGNKPCGNCNPCRTAQKDLIKIKTTNKIISKLSKTSKRILRKIV